MGPISPLQANAAMEPLMGLVKAELARVRVRGRGVGDAGDIRVHRPLLRLGPHTLGAGNLSSEEYEAGHAKEAASAV